MSEVALVFGATGISGIAAIEALKNDATYGRIIAISRRPVEVEGVEHVPIDLINSSVEGIAGHLKSGGADSATHVFFYAYIDSENLEEQSTINNKLFNNVGDGIHHWIPLTIDSRSTRSEMLVHVSLTSTSRPGTSTTCPALLLRSSLRSPSGKTLTDKATSVTSFIISKKTRSKRYQRNADGIGLSLDLALSSA